jgi:hypothetical protein
MSVDLDRLLSDAAATPRRPLDVAALHERVVRARRRGRIAAGTSALALVAVTGAALLALLSDEVVVLAPADRPAAEASEWPVRLRAEARLASPGADAAPLTVELGWAAWDDWVAVTAHGRAGSGVSVDVMTADRRYIRGEDWVYTDEPYTLLDDAAEALTEGSSTARAADKGVRLAWWQDTRPVETRAHPVPHPLLRPWTHDAEAARRAGDEHVEPVEPGAAWEQRRVAVAARLGLDEAQLVARSWQSQFEVDCPPEEPSGCTIRIDAVLLAAADVPLLVELHGDGWAGGFEVTHLDFAGDDDIVVAGPVAFTVLAATAAEVASSSGWVARDGDELADAWAATRAWGAPPPIPTGSAVLVVAVPSSTCRAPQDVLGVEIVGERATVVLDPQGQFAQPCPGPREALRATVYAVAVDGAAAAAVSQAEVRVDEPSPPGPGGEDAIDPVALIGLWEVQDAGDERGAVLRLDVADLRLFRACGAIHGAWNADRSGLFLADRGGWSGACGDDPWPLWLIAAWAHRPAGEGHELLAADGAVLARLVPGQEPTLPPTIAQSEAAPPVVTDRTRQDLAAAAPLPDGLRPAEHEALVGRWIPTDAPAASQAQVQLHTDGTWRASDGCNGMAGRWRTGTGGTLLSAAGGFTTRIGCENIPVAERLRQVARAGLDETGVLVLVDRRGGVLGRFTRSDCDLPDVQPTREIAGQHATAEAAARSVPGLPPSGRLEARVRGDYQAEFGWVVDDGLVARIWVTGSDEHGWFVDHSEYCRAR